MLGQRLNLYDLITFPDRVTRDALRKQYPAISELSQIRTNLDGKYTGEQPIEIVMDYPVTIRRRIEELNQRIFILPIATFQILESYKQIKETDCSDKARYIEELFFYYSEVATYFLHSAFEKSLSIFNEVFEFHINSGIGSIKQISKRIGILALSEPIAREVALKLKTIQDNKAYQDLQIYRNNSVHNVSDSRSALINQREENGVIVTKLKKSKSKEMIMEMLLKCIELLGDYTKFIDRILEKYYDGIALGQNE